MSVYRFTLGQFTLLEDQPHGWDEMEIKIKRDNFNNAMFIIYTSELTFWGEGWNFCKNVIDTFGICGKIDVLIEVDRAHNGKFKTLFDGIADFTEAEIDYERCEIKVVVKDNIILATIADRQNYELWYTNKFWENWTNRTCGGLPVSVIVDSDGVPTDVDSVARKLEIYNITNGTPLAPILAVKPRVGYKVIDALRYHIATLTDNQVKVVSDFFEATNYQQEIWSITVDPTTMGAGDSYDISFKTSLGLTKTATIPFTSNAAVTVGLIADALLQTSNLDRFTTPYETAYRDFSHDMFAFSEIDTGSNPYYIYAQSWMEMSDFTITCNNPVDFTITKIQDLTYGMANLFLGFTDELTAGIIAGSKTIGFERLIKMLDSHFNLGMSLQLVAGTEYVLRIEPKSYFFNQPEIVDVGGVMNIKSEPNKEMTIKNLIVNNRGSDFLGGFTGHKQDWFVDQCETGVTDKSTEGNFDICAIGEQIGNFAEEYCGFNRDDVSFFLVRPEDTGKGLYGNVTNPLCRTATYKAKIINTSPGPSSPDYTLYCFNAGMINPWAVKNHLFNIVGSPKTPFVVGVNGITWTINNSDDAKNRLNYDFDSILTDAQMLAIFNQPSSSVGFNKDSSNHLSKGIYELTWSVNTGKVNFKLFG